MKELFTKTLYGKILHLWYKIQKLCDGAIENCLGELKFLLDCSLTGKIVEKLHDVLLGNGDILFFDEDFSNFIFFAYLMK